MNFVLDCSVAMAWCFEDEATEATDALLDKIRTQGAVVPAIWHLEVANVIVMGERRGRIQAEQSDLFLEDLALLPIATDESSRGATSAPIAALARRARVTAYDASYLEVAIRRMMPLATRDAALRRAAQSVDVALVLG